MSRDAQVPPFNVKAAGMKEEGRCEGPPHSYVRMPYGLPNAAAARQHLMRSILEAQAVRHSAVLVEMEMVREEPPAPPEPPEAPGPGGS